MKVLIVNGYLRQDGNTAKLSNAFAEKLNAEKINVNTIELRNLTIRNCQNCGLCKSEKLCALNDDMTQLYDSILEADAIIMTTPVYMWNMSGVLKVFLDRLHCFSTKYNGKAMGIIVTGGGDINNSGATIIEDSLKRFCNYCNISWAGMLFEQCESDLMIVGELSMLYIDTFFNNLKLSIPKK